MAKLSEKYETMMAFSLKNGEEQVETLKAKFTSLIEANAELISVSEWGKRRLAYPINHETDGYYVLYGFDCKPDFPMELERVLNITEGILRFLTVLRMDAPPKPAPEQEEVDAPVEEAAAAPVEEEKSDDDAAEETEATEAAAETAEDESSESPESSETDED